MFIRILFFIFSFLVDIDAAPLNKAAIEKAIYAEALQKLPHENFEVSLETWQEGWMLSEGGENIKVTDLVFSPNQRRFQASIEISPNVTKKVIGKITWVVQVPVLNRPLFENEMIKESDISFITYSADHLKGNIILHKEELLGKMPCSKKGLKVNTPLSKQDLYAPKVVKRGELIHVILKDPHFEIKICAIANNDGAIGDNILCKGPSQKILTAKIINSQTAEIRIA